MKSRPIHLFTGLFAFALPFASQAAEVTWNGGNFTWDQPDTDSFASNYNNGDNVTFGNTGVGAVTVGAGVTPGTVNFNHSSGTYSFSGTAWDAGTNALNITGAGVVQMGNLTNTAYTPTWGATNISGGGALHYTRGGNIGGNNSTITLNDGTLMVSADNSTEYTYTNAITIGSNGGTVWGRSSVANWTRLNFSGAYSGSGNLTLASSTNGASNAWRGFGLVLSGDNSNYTGAATIVSYRGSTTDAATAMGQYGSALTTFKNANALFPNATSVTVKDGGIVAVDYAADVAFFNRLTIGNRGGIGATGLNGTLGSLSNPMSYVGVGGVLVLDNFNALNNNRIGDTAALALNNNRLHIIGRSASNTQTLETAGAMSFSGGSLFTIDRPNGTNSGVKLTVASLASASAGNSLLIQTPNWGTTDGLNNLLVTGTKPTVSNGMITPGIQYYDSGNILGHFMTFSGNNLVTATYTDYAADWSGAAASAIVNLTAAATLTGSGDKNVHALRVSSGNQDLGGRTIKLGSGGFITTNATTSNGTLDFGTGPGFIGAYNAASQANITAKISGSGGLTVLGASQSLNLNAAHDFTGGLFINGGSVGLSNNAANLNDVTVNPLGRLQAGVFLTVVHNPNIGGLSGTGRVTAFFQGATGDQTIHITPAASTTHTFNGTFSNGDAGRPLNIDKKGLGTQIFGTDSIGQHTGATIVTAGKLVINGNFSTASGDVTVAIDGTLGGIGTIGGATTVNGTLAPGNSTGLLTFNSTLTLANAAVFEIDGTGRGLGLNGYDAVNVDGALTYGGDLTALFGTSFAAGNYFFDLFNFDSQSGTLDSLALSGEYSGTLNSGNNWALNSGANSWDFNHSTGVLSLNVIPEPRAALLGGLGLLALLRRRR